MGVVVSPPMVDRFICPRVELETGRRLSDEPSFRLSRCRKLLGPSSELGRLRCG
jgi:hypothetical protein